jgi:hypothetical protein
MPNSKESVIQGKFIPKCHNFGKIGHIRPNCYLLKSHGPWIKQDTLRAILFVRMLTIFLQRKISSIPTKEAYPPIITAVSQVTSDPNVHIFRLSEVEGSEMATNKSYIRYSTSDYIPGSKASVVIAEVGSCQSEWQIEEEQIKALQEKAAKAH